MAWVKNDETPERKLHAFSVLDDAMQASIKWCNGPIDKGAESRVLYACVIALLRAVGQVLHKVDCDRFPEIQDEVSTRFRSWKKGEGHDVIFREFIEAERNSILKEYELLWSEKNKRELKFRAFKNPVVAGGELSGDLFSESTFSAIVVPEGALAGY
ncbi:MAG: hypothetical protein WBB85_09790, partial [Albidovulum sp.]|uniref:hypothetical protein n=1 Tax=Albidovulum sp. TaxID=1872424 RepID=UPI003CC0C7C3